MERAYPPTLVTLAVHSRNWFFLLLLLPKLIFHWEITAYKYLTWYTVVGGSSEEDKRDKKKRRIGKQNPPNMNDSMTRAHANLSFRDSGEWRDLYSYFNPFAFHTSADCYTKNSSVLICLPSSSASNTAWIRKKHWQQADCWSPSNVQLIWWFHKI